MNVKILFIIAFYLIVGKLVSQENNNEGDFEIKIVRTSENDKSTTGELFVNDKFVCHTLELPWRNNTSYISAIPTGVYKARIRYDKNDNWRIQLENVPDRTYVQIHIGNWPSQIEGCVLVGTKVNNKKNEIVKKTSEVAYNILKKEFYGTSTPNNTPNEDITIKIEYTKARTVFNSTKSSFSYIKQSIWRQTFNGNSQKNDWNEYLRDQKYFYIKDEIGFIHIKIPLHGGQSLASTNQNGPWQKGEIFKRKN